MHFQKTTCFPQLLGRFLLPGKQRPCLKAAKAMDPKEQNLSTLCALNDLIGSKLDFERSIKEHSESRGWPGTREQELPWGHSVSVNVLPVTTALFADKSPAVSNQWQVQDSALHQDGSSAKQAKQLLGWNRAGHPLPLSSASGWKEGRRTGKGWAFRLIRAVTSCYLHERRGLFGPEVSTSVLIFQSSCCSSTGSWLAGATCRMFPFIPWFGLQCIRLLALLPPMISLIVLSVLCYSPSFSLWEQMPCWVFFVYTPQPGPCVWYMGEHSCLMETKQYIKQ